MRKQFVNHANLMQEKRVGAGIASRASGDITHKPLFYLINSFNMMSKEHALYYPEFFAFI
jgi:hypothetical protein